MTKRKRKIPSKHSVFPATVLAQLTCAGTEDEFADFMPDAKRHEFANGTIVAVYRLVRVAHVDKKTTTRLKAAAK